MDEIHAEISEVQNRVKTWIPEIRMMLSRRILETLKPS